MTSRFFQFDSYRSFLKDRFAYLKAVKPGFSARSFARRAEINSPSYFGLVVSGRRNLSLEYAAKFAIGLNLDSFDTECLKAAVALEQSKVRERREALRRLSALRRQATKGSVRRSWSLQLKLLEGLKQLGF